MREISIRGNRKIGDGHPVYVIAEIGINHNGEMDITKKLIDEAHKAGCSAVKFQKRTPEICVPRDQWDKERDTPWGKMSYIDYKKRMEFGESEFAEIDAYCRQYGLDWFASCWDQPSVDFIEKFDPVMYKMASASLTDIPLLQKVKSTGKPMILSTGMSTMEEIKNAITALGLDNILIAHSTSAYPCKPEELNLRMITTLREMYPNSPVGYSGHETGLATTEATIPLGANFVERHFTLDRAMWGTDHAASVEPEGFKRLVRNIREIEIALGNGIKQVYESEREPLRRLRGM
jgi:N-acetylneuraminate synthase